MSLQRELKKAICYFVVLSFSAVICAETILQEFNSMEELNEFWNRSSWGNDNRTHSPDNISIEDGILVLKLSGSQPGELPVCAEITSKRNDFRYGSYSASIKTTNVAGAVVGWFTYLGSPLNEIDVEFLTEDISRVYYTLHHIETGVDHDVIPIDFDPSAGFHEYRFDWHPDRVDYYIDGEFSSSLTNQVPDMESRIMLNHWSGNIPGWGGPAPAQDVYMWVDYMRYSSEYPDSGETAARDPFPAAVSGRMFTIFQTKKILSVECAGKENSSLQIFLYNLRGETVIQKKMTRAGSAGIDIRSLAGGAYILGVDGRGICERRVVHLMR